MSKKEVCILATFLVIIFLNGCAKQIVPEAIPEKEILEENKTTLPIIPEYDTGFMVLKGDTVITPFGSEIALIGVDAPEREEPCFEESVDKLKSLVLGKNMTLYRDVSDMNRYGKYLRYVFVDDVLVNEAMIRSGLVKAVAEAPDTEYSDLFYEAQVDAVSKRLCLWKGLEADPCLFVAFFNYDAYGVDEYNLNDEFVTFRSICKAKIDLTGWTVQDSVGLYTFPKFVLGPEAAVTLHSGQGQDSETHLYWGNEVSVWDDESDTLYLRNPNNNIIIRRHY